MVQRFKALKNFADPETGSEYCVAMTYSIHPGNATLSAKVALWVTMGRVEMIPSANPQSTVTGKGG